MYVRAARIYKNIISINRKSNKHYICTYGMHDKDLFWKNLINISFG